MEGNFSHYPQDPKQAPVQGTPAPQPPLQGAPPPPPQGMPPAPPRPSGISILSVVSLVISVLALACYSLLFTGIDLRVVFIILSIVSVFLPAAAKEWRLNRNQKGKTLEIIAIVVGGMDVYSIIFGLTELPLLIGYLGWVLAVIAYLSIKKK